MRGWTKCLIACAALLLAGVPAWALGPIILFFEPGSAHITPHAAVILDDTAVFIRRADVREIVIPGSTDRVGTNRANLDLSRRRAEAVRAALLARGMSRHIRVQIVAAGETRPLVQTDNDVAEAQNRHAVILFYRLCTEGSGARLTGGICDTPLPE